MVSVLCKKRVSLQLQHRERGSWLQQSSRPGSLGRMGWQRHRVFLQNGKSTEKKEHRGVTYKATKSGIKTGEDTLTVNNFLGAHLNSFGCGVTHTHTSRATHVAKQCTSPHNKIQLHPRVQTKFMELPVRGETTQLPLIQGLHGQIVVSPTFPPHTHPNQRVYTELKICLFLKYFFFQEGIIFSWQVLEGRAKHQQYWMDSWTCQKDVAKTRL